MPGNFDGDHFELRLCGHFRGYYCVESEVTKLSVDDKLALGVNEMALKMLATMLDKFKGALMQMNPNTLQGLMRGMSLLINGKRNNMRTSALDICLFIYAQIGEENYLQLMNCSLPQN